MRNLTLSIIAVAVLITGCGPVEDHVDRDTYVSLFNGRDLEGWVIENDALFSVQAGCLVVEKGVGWLRSKDLCFVLMQSQSKYLTPDRETTPTNAN